MSDKLQVPVIAPKTKKPLSYQADTLPTDYTPVITHARPREIQFMRWRLIPSFTRNPKQGAPMFNARAETLMQLPSFRGLVMTSRCLILNTGFYERETQGDERVEWKVSPKNEEYFYKAGLWTTWRNPENGEITESFTMITCDPEQSKLGKIHDRMPIIVNKEERRLWMNPNASKEQLLSLLRPCSDELFEITEHSRKLLKVPKNKGTNNLF